MRFWETLRDAVDRFEAASVVDILTIAVLIYLALLLLKGTTAMSLLRGIVIVVVVAVILVQVLDLTVLDWLLRNSLPALIIAIPIVFQQEIRRFLERVGRTGRWPWPGRALYEGVVDVVADASLSLGENRRGAIIVMERDSGLEDYIDTGVKLDAAPSTQLLEGIFYPNSPLHDGAVILRENRVVAASCTLPLSDRIDREFLSTMEDDLEIWRYQRYVEHPALAQQDAKPYGQLRKWVRQFYEIAPDEHVEKAPA